MVVDALRTTLPQQSILEIVGNFRIQNLKQSFCFSVPGASQCQLVKQSAEKETLVQSLALESSFV